MGLNLNLPVCMKASKLVALSLVFSAISSFPQLLSHEADTIVSYSTEPLLATLSCLSNHELCYTQLLQVLHT